MSKITDDTYVSVSEVTVSKVFGDFKVSLIIGDPFGPIVTVKSLSNDEIYYHNYLSKVLETGRIEAHKMSWETLHSNRVPDVVLPVEEIHPQFTDWLTEAWDFGHKHQFGMFMSDCSCDE